MAKIIVDSGFKDWKPDRLPDLAGKTYVITGGNSGIGFDAATMLGKAGANLLLACRSVDKARVAKRELEQRVTGTVDLVQLDLSDLTSIRAAADELRGKYSKLDGLINNAGIMQTPKSKTKDGFELQFGTNHLGHFMLTSLLIDLVEAAAGRVCGGVEHRPQIRRHRPRRPNVGEGVHAIESIFPLQAGKCSVRVRAGPPS